MWLICWWSRRELNPCSESPYLIGKTFGAPCGPMISPHNRTKRDLMAKTCVLNALLRFPYLCGADLQTKKCESAHFYKRIMQISKTLGRFPKSAFCVNSGNATVLLMDLQCNNAMLHCRSSKNRGFSTLFRT